MTTRAGKLDHRLTLLVRVDTVDEGGGRDVSWETVAQPWAETRTTGGREQDGQSGVVSNAKRIERIRYRSGVTTAMRVEVGGETYDITAADIVGRRGFLDLSLEQVPHGAS
jgi:SPP1 family predicted phage head-tail adaptor